MFEAIQAFVVTHWVYLPLVIVLLLIVWLYHKFLKHFRYNRMVESVRSQKRVNLSPWTNARLLVVTLFWIFLVIGLVWANYGTLAVLLYSSSIYFGYLILEWLYRKHKTESTKLVGRLMGVVALFLLLVLAYQQGFGLPLNEFEKPTVDLYLKVSNDSYAGAPVISGEPTDLASGKVFFVDKSNIEYELGLVSDRTDRTKGNGEGWSSFIFDLGPYLGVNLNGESVKIRIKYDTGVDCLAVKDVSALVNKIKGIFAVGMEDKIDQVCATGDSVGEYQINLE